MSITQLPAEVQSALRVETSATTLRVARMLSERLPSRTARTLALTALLSGYLKAAGATEETIVEYFKKARTEVAATTLSTAEWRLARYYAATDDELPPNAADCIAMLRSDAIRGATSIHLED